MRIARVETLWVLLTLLVLLLAVWWIPGAASVKNDSYSVAFVGKRVLFQAMKRMGDDVVRSNDELIPNAGERDRILILGPARKPNEEEIGRLFSEVYNGGTLVYAAPARDAATKLDQFGVEIVNISSLDEIFKFPEEEEEEDAAEPEEESAEEPEKETEQKTVVTSEVATESTSTTQKSGEEVEEETADDEASAAEYLPPLSEFLPLPEKLAETDLVKDQLMWFSNGRLELKNPDAWEVLLTTDDGPQIVRRRLGSGQIMICASDEVFTNGSMLQPPRSILAYRILEAAPAIGRTYFDETLNGSGVPKVVGILFAPLFRPITLQLILITVLFGWLGSRRFGPIYHDVSVRRRSIVEHAQALGTLYYRAHAGAHALRNMREYLKLQLRLLYGSTFHTESAESIARQARREPDEVKQLFRDLKRANRKHRNGKLSNAETGRLLRQLSELIEQIRSN